jgi:hypothetical protein
MESPDRKRQKVLKAKKTMPTSYQKQLEILNKSTNVEAPKTTVGTNIPNGNQSLNPGFIASKYTPSEHIDSSFNSLRIQYFHRKG